MAALNAKLTLLIFGIILGAALASNKHNILGTQRKTVLPRAQSLEGRADRYSSHLVTRSKGRPNMTPQEILRKINEDKMFTDDLGHLKDYLRSDNIAKLQEAFKFACDAIRNPQKEAKEVIFDFNPIARVERDQGASVSVEMYIKNIRWTCCFFYLEGALSIHLAGHDGVEETYFIGGKLGVALPDEAIKYRNVFIPIIKVEHFEYCVLGHLDKDHKRCGESAYHALRVAMWGLSSADYWVTLCTINIRDIAFPGISITPKIGKWCVQFGKTPEGGLMIRELKSSDKIFKSQ